MRLLAAALIAIHSLAAAAPGNAPPKIDKTKFAAYVRYAEAFTPEVNIMVDDPVPSAYQGYYRVIVHVSLGPQTMDRIYYVTADGQHFINGQVWDISKDPFLDTLKRLPESGPEFGPADAKVTIVLFSDFECPYCRALAQTIRENVPKYYPNDVRVIFVNFPLVTHMWARAAAETGYCLWEEKPGAFWAYHDWIFAHQQQVTDAKPPEKTIASEAVEMAKQQGADAAKMNHCIETHAAAETVNSNVRLGQELGITQTPTFFVDGRMVAGSVDWATLDTLIKMELNRPKEIPGPPEEKCCEVVIPRLIPK
jgi:protein-disulfide isomerase